MKALSQVFTCLAGFCLGSPLAIAADPSGSWIVEGIAGEGGRGKAGSGAVQESVLVLSMSDGNLTGSMSLPGRHYPVPISAGSLVGDRISFTLVRTSTDGTKTVFARYSGKLQGGTIEGTVERAGRGGQAAAQGGWVAKLRDRASATEGSIPEAAVQKGSNWGDPVRVEQKSIPGLDVVMVKIPRGTFAMGESGGSSTSDVFPAHQVTFSRDFWLGAMSVTVGQFQHFVTVTGYLTEAERTGAGIIVKEAEPKRPGLSWRDPGIPNYKPAENHPVLGISWNDAQQFCRWLTDREGSAGRLPEGYVYRLPTEAQWVYAARAGGAGTPDHPQEFAWFVENSGGVPHPVATRKPNPWGLYDMMGNGWNWVHDWYGRYPSEPVADPEGPASANAREVIRPHRERRGSSWNDDADKIIPGNRWSTWGITESCWLGFRLALAPPPKVPAP